MVCSQSKTIPIVQTTSSILSDKTFENDSKTIPTKDQQVTITKLEERPHITHN